MSLALAESRRLVAPVELLSMVPSVIAVEASEPQLVFQPAQEEYEQNFVLAARMFAAAHPRSPAAVARLAQAEQAVGQTEAAAEAALRALSLTRKNADPAASFAAAQVLIHSGEIEAAERAVGQMADGLVQIMLRARLAIRRGDLEGALGRIGELDTLDALAMRGWLSLELRRFSEAVRYFRAALRKGGPSPTLLVNLAYAHAALGVRAKAIRETKQAQALAPASRLIGLNLVAYYLADEEFDRALAEIKRMREQAPKEIRLAFAEADVHLLADDVIKAEATLRRARTSDLWVSADLAERAELTADLAFLEWRLGRRDREDAKRVVLDELERTDFEAFPISTLLPALMRTSDEASELASVCERLAERHHDESLYALRTQLAFLRLEFDEAARLAASWAADEILNPHAAAVAVYLLADVEGDLESALALGRTALARAGHTQELVNNVAYVLAPAGKLSEADQLLPRETGGSVFLTATRALVDILAGRIEEGIKGYDRAYELATKHSDPDLPQLVLANRQLALYRASKRGLVDLGDVTVMLPRGWETHPHFALVKWKAEREGVDCSTVA